MPTTSRPPDSTSIVASIFEVTTAGRCGTTITASTMRILLVLAAIQAAVVSCSTRWPGSGV